MYLRRIYWLKSFDFAERGTDIITLFFFSFTHYFFFALLLSFVLGCSEKESLLNYELFVVFVVAGFYEAFRNASSSVVFEKERISTSIVAIYF